VVESSPRVHHREVPHCPSPEPLSDKWAKVLKKVGDALEIQHKETGNPPQLLCQQVHLKRLTLKGMKITRLPENFGRLSQLTHLILTHNSLSTLPPSIAQCAQIEVLDLSHNAFEELPQSVTHLPALRELHLINNQLKTLPAQVGDLHQLAILSLSWNQELRSLPQSIATCPLEKVFLTHRSAESDEVLAPLATLTTLRELNLTHNTRFTLPEGFSHLEKLTVTGTGITTPPKGSSAQLIL
ncbi:MAG: hypothetical protein KDK65_01615, partial [Chlamydiia bacterium]|nr:hypothetical protein [Chlamydiia bacterium]